jgi:hypothetical protein
VWLDKGLTAKSIGTADIDGEIIADIFFNKSRVGFKIISDAR